MWASNGLLPIKNAKNSKNALKLRTYLESFIDSIIDENSK